MKHGTKIKQPTRCAGIKETSGSDKIKDGLNAKLVRAAVRVWEIKMGLRGVWI